MITALEVRNFRAFAHQRIEFGRLTIVLGPSNSGKSALLSALPLMAQTLRSSDWSTPLLLYGPLKDLGTYKDLVFGHDLRRAVTLRLETRIRGDLKNSPSAAVEMVFRQRPGSRELVLTRSALECPLGETLVEHRA